MVKPKSQSVPTLPSKMELSSQGETRSLPSFSSKASSSPIPREKRKRYPRGETSVHLTGSSWRGTFPLKKAHS